MGLTPFQIIQQNLHHILPDTIVDELPKKWEKIGRILIIKLSPSLLQYSEQIGSVYADVLHCDAVLADTGGITGPYREPNITHIFGTKKTETTHYENGICYHLDPQHIMFSSGNIDERKRISTLSNPSEIVVDLFAGIGYFTIPLAVYSKPKKIYACEINKKAFSYLEKNIAENHVEDTVEPLYGDSRDVAPQEIADRVIMGYFHETASFLKTALQSLKHNSGIIHYHDTFPDTTIPQMPLSEIQTVCSLYTRHADLLRYHRIKSYAPGISHYVFDVKITEEG